MASSSQTVSHYQAGYMKPATPRGSRYSVWQILRSCAVVWLVLKFHDTWGEAKYQLSTAGIVTDTHKDPERPVESQKELGFFRYFRVLKNMERSSHKKGSPSLPGFPVTAHHCLVTTAVTKCSSVTALDSSDISK